MGTSRSNIVPSTSAFKKVAGSLRSPVRNPSTVAQLTLSAALDYIPVGYAGSPVVFAAAEGIRFATLAKKEGFESAVKKEAIHIVKNLIAPSVSHELWKAAASRLGPKFASSPYGQLAEKAFKKTVSAIIAKGAEALEG